MVDEVVKTVGELYAELETAMEAKDMKAVRTLSSAIDKAEKVEVQAVKDAKQQVVAKVTDDMKAAIDKVVQKVIDGLESDILEAMDGVWYSNDFGDKLSTCKLVKGAVRKAGTGGGGGKKFSVTTNELLEKYGDQPNGDSGVTLNEAYEATTDGNKRYNIRMKLLKIAGIS